ncbi:hypothetical protein [Mesorhizobium sp. NZP2077]|uniref:hypothetical protein n=1 Tax=Mesorhizobium sp. NZP2077 TaxID=2483404 RepID=UPI001FEED0E4|nr:hypothetical protein [Mesorhizobium sp. NZP2077]
MLKSSSAKVPLPKRKECLHQLLIAIMGEVRDSGMDERAVFPSNTMCMPRLS